MPPNVSSAMNTHETPAPKKPQPKAKPSHAPSRAAGARCHSQNSSASVASVSGGSANGANANTAAAPAASASRRVSRTRTIRIRTSCVGIRRRRRGDALDLHGMQAAAVGAQHAEAQALHRRGFAALGQAPERAQHEAAYGVELVVGKRGAELLVEVGDLRLRL